jgi:hypothetical protein
MTREKRIRLRYDGRCSCCGKFVPAHSYAYYDDTRKTVRCTSCPASPTPTPSNTPGASARREHDRRKAKDKQRLREKWGRFGGVAVALSDERSSTKAWERGTVGEERVAAILAKLEPARGALLHDRRIPGSRANIDHIAVTAAGIWVIDAKRYAGRPQLKASGGLFRPRVQKLYVGSRDCTSLVDGVLDQVAHVQAGMADVPVHPVLCFVDSDWDVSAGPDEISGVGVTTPRRLKRALSKQTEGPFPVAAMAKAIAARFPPA